MQFDEYNISITKLDKTLQGEPEQTIICTSKYVKNCIILALLEDLKQFKDYKGSHKTVSALLDQVATTRILVQ